MAENESSSEKNQQPTPKKLKDARKEGQVVKSKELTSFFSLISFFGYFLLMYKSIQEDMSQIYDVVFKGSREFFLFASGIDKLIAAAKILLIFAFKIILIPVLIAASVSGLIAMVQVNGIVFSPKALEIKFDKFNMVTNAKNIFGMQNLKKFFKDIIQLSVMTLVSVYLIISNIDNVLYSGYYSLGVITAVFFKVLCEIFIYLLLIYLIFAIIDYIIEYTSFMKKMMMSLEEIKKEMKDTEVSQNVKQKQREIHEEIMSEEDVANMVKNSTMIVTNPTHIAVAVFYDPDKVKLPVVIFKAKDRAAQIVRKVAAKQNILLVRDVWIARQLYSLAELKKYIPSTLIAPVADLIGKNMHLLPPEIQESFKRQRLQTPAAPAPVKGPEKPNLF